MKLPVSATLIFSSLSFTMENPNPPQKDTFEQKDLGGTEINFQQQYEQLKAIVDHDSRYLHPDNQANYCPVEKKHYEWTNSLVRSTLLNHAKNAPQLDNEENKNNFFLLYFRLTQQDEIEQITYTMDSMQFYTNYKIALYYEQQEIKQALKFMHLAYGKLQDTLMHLAHINKNKKIFAEVEDLKKNEITIIKNLIGILKGLGKN